MLGADRAATLAAARWYTTTGWTTAGSSVNLVTELRKAFHGQLLLPDSDGYVQARRVWNGNIDKYPAIIALAPKGTQATIPLTLGYPAEVDGG